MESLTESLESGVASLQLAERDREVEQNRLVQLQRSFSETRAQLGSKQRKAEQVKADLQRTTAEIEADTEHVEEDEQNLKNARDILQEAIDQMEQDTQQRAVLQQARHECQQLLENARAKAREHRDAAHQLALKIQSRGSRVISTEQAMSRLQGQQLIFVERKKSLETLLSESEEPQILLKHSHFFFAGVLHAGSPSHCNCSLLPERVL